MNTSIPQVLIPIDFSEQSLLALDQSHNLAKFYNAELTLLYSMEEGNWLKRFFRKQTNENVLKKEHMAKLEELGETIRKKYTINTNIRITKGNVANEILKMANEISAKLIIMGAYGAARTLKNKLIGTSVIRVVSGASCPVVTIKGKSIRTGCKNIVMPVDLTKESRQKVKTAIELGKLYGATIHVISMLYTLDKDTAKRLTKQLDILKKTITTAQVNCVTEVISMVKKNEPMANTVINYANKIEADLIMIMTQQEGELRPLFISSTAQSIIHNSDVPVISVVPSTKRIHELSI